MIEKKERIIIVLTVLISAIVLIAVSALVMIDRRRLEQPPAEYGQQQYQEPSSELPLGPAKPEVEPSAEPAESAKPEVEPSAEPAESAKPEVEPSAEPKPSLNDVISKARTWGPAFTPWVGKPAPDFTLTDITGKQHKLSDYRGKDVLIIFWATWCRPCLMEVPHLVALRNIIEKDKLAMLAISNENPAVVKKFVATQRVKINYTVLSDPGTMPAPFDRINSIPCSFFIEADGKIKLATVGTLSLGAIKAILQAE